MKIYPRTAPEIPTGESSIGWEVGEAGWATVPPHHPPRGSGTVSANSPGSPGLRKQGRGPWLEGRAVRTPAWGSPRPASLSGKPAMVSKGTNTHVHTCVHTRAPLKHLPCLGPFHRRFCLRLTRGGGRGQVRTSPWRGGLLRIFPRPVSLLPGWGPLLLLRDKEGARAQLGQESRKKGCPSPLRKNSGWSLTTFESCPEGFTPFST